MYIRPQINSQTNDGLQAGRQPRQNTRPGKPTAGPVTYGELIAHHLELLETELRSKGKTRQLARNHRSAIRAWMRGRYSEDTPVGQEFGSKFTPSLREHLDALAGEKKSRTTISSRKTILTRWRETWAGMVKERGDGSLPAEFSAALTRLKEEAGVSYAEIARQVRVKSANSIEEWAKGRSLPRYKSLPVVSRLEQYFRQPEGTLLSRLPRFLRGGDGKLRRGLTPYRRHQQKARKDHYLLRDWPAHAAAEWDRLVRVYTDPAWARLQGEQRDSYWRVREHDGSCPTAGLHRKAVSGFYGYLCLAVNEAEPTLGGKGLSPEDLSLALLSDAALVYDYLEFKRERTYRKSYNTQTKVFLIFCSSLLRAETGYLWRHRHFSSRLREPLPEEAWRDWCGRNRSTVAGFRRDFQKQKKFKQTRDPFDGVRAIIANEQHPIDVLLDLADAVEADMPPPTYRPCSLAHHYQHLFLVKFVTNVPLRTMNLVLMTYRADNTGHLYQRSDGTWWVRFAAGEFKNEQWVDDGDDYDIPVEESLRPVIEEYLWRHRPNLVGADACDYVFRPAVVHRKRSVSSPVCPINFSQKIYLLSQRYLPGCAGFRLHAVRHLAATEFIKNRPDGFAVAAAVLHDHERTVREAYAWVTPKDKIRHWNEYFRQQQERRALERAGAPAGSGR